MDEEQLALIEDGLNLLIKKLKLNQTEGDLKKVKVVQDAKVAIRKVMLAMAIKGEIKEITPVIENTKGAGWEVTDGNNKIVRYHA